ncbi:hypothetical protein LTR96_011099 [Exophiala xenobiotica]|nr:hypothetical protein LTR72_011416 [Exophiala xenobiotica]KAK5263515.1 hypothetical protein LTR96_011099 [Exophiala xenobiotica]KAK5284885.1 hypothetical protein LTR14_011415 [Exophiala xenobiotica]KAK5332759.1 hypothetical protein LTR98_011131 [Exophiala xenobiotica]KAK5469032.1 hypothetical protein LTR55_011438 [Exophiala xenobiotica]
MYPTDSCIEIAADHRLQRLVGSVPYRESSRNGNHGNLLRELAQSIIRPNEDIFPEEIDFTAWQSEPVSTGGPMAMLQQPADKHPYHRGRESTFQSCATLVALDACFKFASSGTMGLDNVTVVDDLPYTRKKDTTTPDYRRAIRSQVLNIILAKRPSVLLCMSQEREESPSPTARFKSLGIGMAFRTPIIRLGADHYIKRVNAFHPSYALYHRPNESAFRQLLLLEVSRTCGELRGDWKEEDWMQDLRRNCREKARQQQPDVRQVMFPLHRNK